ncbi:uncharacterized protein LY89DRAFT_721837 [Mollisia scopiformis]|uniref:Uncharacterized protein n=1 Tax=Mollisia scopiformis TaxID=149040 RepID=A0A194WYM1_MOLSC|nr:uncharacterized protein LY89DRAFT_721837 [Mollisia scopiformis]KUJ13045.1 hypothetical protein LY89DRAFT_721837 [Mollisia scopiformis]
MAIRLTLKNGRNSEVPKGENVQNGKRHRSQDRHSAELPFPLAYFTRMKLSVCADVPLQIPFLDPKNFILESPSRSTLLQSRTTSDPSAPPSEPPFQYIRMANDKEGNAKHARKKPPQNPPSATPQLMNGVQDSQAVAQQNADTTSTSTPSGSENASKLIEQAIQTLTRATIISDDTDNYLRKKVKDLEVALINAAKERDEAIKEAVEIRATQGYHDAELTKAKDNHKEHVQKVKAGHQKEIEELKTTFEKEKVEYQKKIDEPTKLRQEREKLTVENKSLKKNLAAMQVTNKTLSEETEKLRKERDLLDKLCKYLKKTLCKTEAENGERGDLLKKVCERLSLEMTILQENFLALIPQYKEEQEKEPSYYHEVISLYEEETARLYKQVSDLEKDQDVKAPLVEVGVKIRNRYRVQEARTGRRDEDDQLAVDEGNQAAHGQNGPADKAVFDLGRWTEKQYGTTLKNVYRSKLDGYDEAMKKYNQVLKYWSWLNCSQPTACTFTHYYRANLLMETMLLVIGSEDGHDPDGDSNLREKFDFFYDRLERLLEEIMRINELGELKVDIFNSLQMQALGSSTTFHWSYMHDKASPTGFSYMSVRYPDIMKEGWFELGRYAQTVWSVTYHDPADGKKPVEKKRRKKLARKTYASVAASQDFDDIQDPYRPYVEVLYEETEEQVGEVFDETGVWEAVGQVEEGFIGACQELDASTANHFNGL